MRRYRVETAPSPEADIIDSFVWGCEVWGVEEAVAWANEIWRRILKNLSTSPLKYHLAPKRVESGRDYRQMIVDRYRVIFHIEGSTVRVIHVTGSFVDPEQRD